MLVEATKGKHSSARATVDDLFDDWIVVLKCKGRSSNTVHGYAKSYENNICPTLSRMAVTTVTTKTLTDLYGAHQARGLAPRTVYQIHACRSSVFTRACRWDGVMRTPRSGPGRRRVRTRRLWWRPRPRSVR